MTVHKNFWLTRLEGLHQTTTVDAYYLSFEALRGLIEYTDPYISELYYTSLFVNGLDTEVQAYVEGFLPLTVLDAYCLAAIFDNGYSHTIRSKQAEVLKTVSVLNLVDSPVIVNSEVKTCKEGNVAAVVSVNVASLHENASNDNKETPLATSLEAKVDFTLFKMNASSLQRVIPKMCMAAISQCVVVSIGISPVTALMEDVDIGSGIVDAYEAIRDKGGTIFCLPTVNGLLADEEDTTSSSQASVHAPVSVLTARNNDMSNATLCSIGHSYAVTTKHGTGGLVLDNSLPLDSSDYINGISVCLQIQDILSSDAASKQTHSLIQAVRTTICASNAISPSVSIFLLDRTATVIAQCGAPHKEGTPRFSTSTFKHQEVAVFFPDTRVQQQRAMPRAYIVLGHDYEDAPVISNQFFLSVDCNDPINTIKNTTITHFFRCLDTSGVPSDHCLLLGTSVTSVLLHASSKSAHNMPDQLSEKCALFFEACDMDNVLSISSDAGSTRNSMLETYISTDECRILLQFRIMPLLQALSFLAAAGPTVQRASPILCVSNSLASSASNSTLASSSTFLRDSVNSQFVDSSGVLSPAIVYSATRTAGSNVIARHIKFRLIKLKGRVHNTKCCGLVFMVHMLPQYKNLVQQVELKLL